MTIETSSAETILPANASALIATVAGDLEFIMAHGPDDSEVPANVQLLCAVLLRGKDPVWVNKMSSWHEAQNGTI